MNNMENNSFYNNFLTSLKAYLYDETVKLNTLSTDNSAVIALAQQEVSFLSQINPYVEVLGELLQNIENISINIDSLNRDGIRSNDNNINGLPELQPLNIDDVKLNANLEVDDDNKETSPVQDESSGIVDDGTNVVAEVPAENQVMPTEGSVDATSVVPAIAPTIEQPLVEENTPVVEAPAVENQVVPTEGSADVASVVPAIAPTIEQPLVEENTPAVEAPVVENQGVPTEESVDAASVVPAITPPVEQSVVETPTGEGQPQITENQGVPIVNNTPLVAEVSSSLNPTVDTSASEVKQGSSNEVDINSVIYNKVDTNPAKAVLTSSSQIKKLRASRVNCEMEFFNTIVREDTVEAKQKKIEYLMTQASQLYNEGKKQEAQVLYDEIRKLNDELQKSSQ